MPNLHHERVDGLHPMLHAPVRELLRLSEVELHRPLLVVRGWASVAEQLLVYQQGRTYNPADGTWEVTDASKVVSNAKPGSSAHNVISKAGETASMAVDVIPVFPDGTPDWNVPQSYWEQLYVFAWKVGLDPLGDAIGAYLKGDRGHFEELRWQWKLEGLGCLRPTA